MKKIYSTPVVEIKETVAFEMMALSLKDDKADGSEALSRKKEWDIWNDEDVED